MSKKFYQKGKWHITTNHGWKIGAATNTTEDLFVACPDVIVKIRDMEIDQNFFVQDEVSYSVILKRTLHHSFMDGNEGAL